MFPLTLATALIAFGSGCIVISIYIFHYFKDRVSSHVDSQIFQTFSSKELASFLDAVKKGKVTSIILQDFLKQMSAICRPQQWLKKSWTYTLSSGILLIIDGLLGSFIDFQNAILDYVAYTLLILAISIFVLGIWQLIRLGRKLM